MMRDPSPGDAQRLHQGAIVVDGHCDILVSVADGKARLGQLASVPDPRTWAPPAGVRGEGELSAHGVYYGPASQYSLPQWQDGGVTVQVCAIYLDERHLDRALQRGLEMTWWLHHEVEENAGLKLVTSPADIRQVKAAGLVGVVLSFEGCEPLGADLRLLDVFYKLGLRMASLTHSRRNAFADGMQAGVRGGGLTALGRQAVSRMNDLGIVVDLAHLNQTGFWEVLELTRHPVVLSHGRPRVHFPRWPEESRWHPQHDVSLGWERLEALRQNGGVMGVIWYNQANLDDVIADTEYLLERMGADHVALGSDLYGLELAPAGLENIARLPALTEALARRGHSDEVILKILGGNYFRVFERVWQP